MRSRRSRSFIRRRKSKKRLYGGSKNIDSLVEEIIKLQDTGSYDVETEKVLIKLDIEFLFGHLINGKSKAHLIKEFHENDFYNEKQRNLIINFIHNYR